jgi:DNA-binding transcriptional MerR regulator
MKGGKRIMKIKEASQYLGVAPDTLRKWEKAGIINSERTPLGHRVFTPEAILQIQQITKLRSLERRKLD